ncbi:MAG: hypothetical protein ABGX08_17455 [Citromicrobium sp.]
MMGETSLVDLLAGGATMGGSLGITLFFLKWAAEFVSKRADKQAERNDAGTRELIERLNAEVERLANDCAELREGLRACERKHLESDAEVMRLKAMLQGFGEARDKASLIVAAEKLQQKDKGE